jgi:O-antigen/teichoic acid export membrane protein
VAALTRIGQIFAVIGTFYSIVIEPYIARLERSRLLRIYLAVLMLALVSFAPLVFLAFRFPGIYLWLIGPKYAGVRDLLGWYVLSAALNCVSTAAWVMNRARKWVFWSGSILEVVLVLAVQVVVLATVGVKNTRQAVFLGCLMSVCYLIAHGYVAVIGFHKGPPAQQTNVVPV